MRARLLVTSCVVTLACLTWLAARAINAAVEPTQEFHANNTTKLVFADGTTCYYHRAWRQMSCVHVEPYGPSEF